MRACLTPTLMMACAINLIGASAGARAAADRITVHRCTASDGGISYQQQPCPANATAQPLQVDAEVSATRRAQAAATAAAVAAAVRQDPPDRLASAPVDPPPPAAPKPRVRCPRTRENPGPIGVSGTDAWSLAIARSIYEELPSETWLKNTGRWPRDCAR